MSFFVFYLVFYCGYAATSQVSLQLAAQSLRHVDKHEPLIHLLSADNETFDKDFVPVMSEGRYD
jgi:hypothetical protein